MSTDAKNTEKGPGDTTEVLQAKIADQAAEIEKLKSVTAKQADELKDAETLITEQQKRLSAEPAETTGGDIVVKSGKKRFRVMAKKFRHEGKEYSDKSLLKNKELVEKLIKLGSSVLQQL